METTIVFTAANISQYISILHKRVLGVRPAREVGPTSRPVPGFGQTAASAGLRL
jgi:hypothetical protein